MDTLNIAIIRNITLVREHFRIFYDKGSLDKVSKDPIVQRIQSAHVPRFLVSNIR